MDTFFGPGGVLNDDPFYDIRIPYAGQIPPLGYTLFHDFFVVNSHNKINTKKKHEILLV